jgi:hypothetical protein
MAGIAKSAGQKRSWSGQCSQLRKEYVAAGKVALFDQLKDWAGERSEVSISCSSLCAGMNDLMACRPVIISSATFSHRLPYLNWMNEPPMFPCAGGQQNRRTIILHRPAGSC